MQDKLIPVFVGAILALTTSVLLQSLIVPWVQSRTRRRERWERSIADLSVLVSDEIPKAMAEYRAAAGDERLFLTFRGDPKYDAMKVEEGLRAASEARREADRVISRLSRRLNNLNDRVISVRHKAPGWFPFTVAFFDLSMSISDITFAIYQATPLDDDGWQSTWDQHRLAIDKYEEKVHALELSMRPPKRQLLRRLRRLAKSKVKSVKDRLDPRNWKSTRRTIGEQ
ncbi:hypothetical protein ACXJJ3_24065 [Kribbella sp. WER1]